MAREDYYNKINKENLIDDIFDDITEDDIEPDILKISPTKETERPTASTKEEVAVTEEAAEPETKKKTPQKRKPAAKQKSKAVSPLDFGSKEPQTVSKSFRISPELSQLIDGMTRDKKGNKISGSRGFMKAFANNALIKEMVEIGFLDESHLDDIIPYDEI